MNKRNKIVATAATAFVIVAGGAGLAIAGTSGEDAHENEAPITGTALGQAKSAALDHVGQGTVTDTETGDEESYYEVEVTLDDGSETDVQLDRSFKVVGQEAETGNEANDTE
ncbi:MAG: PepSY domain-containing protein [Solirubrobacterales bacterium]